MKYWEGLNDFEEKSVAFVAGSFFIFFGLMGYLTGKYLPVLSFFKCYLLVWNPFMREPDFLEKLQNEIILYLELYNSNQLVMKEPPNVKDQRLVNRKWKNKETSKIMNIKK